MQPIEAPLIVSLVVSSLINGPQLLQTWRTRDVQSFSVYTMVLRVINNLAWIVYAVLIREWVILSMSVLNGASELALLYMKYRWQQDTVLYNNSDANIANGAGAVRCYV